MIIAASLAFIFALCIFFFVPLHPSHVGVYIEDMDEKEILEYSAMQK
jgi:hypothetical protein